ncbi:MAG: hypothetical protein CK424_05860 [Legionella sp.]|nr:MAG: hypothetical protein CK424_05860 [Legionella sp.]
MKMIALLLLSGAAQAGTMGDISSAPHPYVPFVSFEGNYTWSAIGNNSPTASFSKQPWGGRIAIGANREWRDNLGLMFEAGYGYYGKSTVSDSITSAPSELLTASVAGGGSNTILGADILGGLSFTHNQFSLFGEAGMMVETLWFKGSGNINASLLNTININAGGTLRDSHTAVLPELKVGGKYAISESLDLTLSYMHVFGSNLAGGNAEILLPNLDASKVAGTLNMQVPTLNTILFGIHYNFV